MSYVQIFTSSMFAIKNDDITSFPSSCCCSWAKSHLTQWLESKLFSSIVLVIQPVNHNYFLKELVTDEGKHFKGIKCSLVCPSQITLSNLSHCCLLMQIMYTWISWQKNIFHFLL